MKKCSLRAGFAASFSMLALLICTFSARVTALDHSAIPTANRTPIIRTLGLPAAESAIRLSSGDSKLRLTLEHSSLFIVDDEGPERAFIDGESSSVTLSYRRALSDRLVIGAELPLLSHQTGFMDSFVEGWHRTFGFPNGRRDEFARDQLRYSISTPNGSIDLNSSATGLGDIALLAQYKLHDAGTSRLTGQLRVEVPSGDSDELLGSGSVDVAIGGLYANSQLLSAVDAHFNAGAGILFPGDSDLLPELQKNTVFYANATLARRLFKDWLTVKLQLEAHTALYDTNIKALGSTSVQFSFGAGLRLSKRWIMNIAMSEDIAVRTAPDFTVLLGLEYR
ncbi:MAG: DUF3187 family protein [Pseudomonadales bacterium]